MAKMTKEEARKVLEGLKELTVLPLQTGDALDFAIEALKADKKKPKKWKPGPGQTYYILGDSGVIYTNTWMFDTTDARLRERRKIFPTEEEAKYAAECELVEAELQNYADENNEHEIVWDGDSTNIYLYYDHTEDTIRARGIWREHHKDVYFTSYEIALNAIKQIGEERLKKYYFKVV